jgi:hypothetical protein
MTTSSHRTKPLTVNLQYPRSWQTAPNRRATEAAVRVEAWLDGLGVLDDEAARKIFGALAAGGIAGRPYPAASLDRLETITAFLSLWVLLDDRVEKGEMKVDNRLLEAIRGKSDDPPADGFLRGWWQLARKTRWMGRSWNDRHQRRFEAWLSSQREEAAFVGRYRESGAHPGVQDYVAFRRTNIGVLIATDFIEYSLGDNLPWELREHPTLRTIEILAAEAMVWANDLYGFTKDREARWTNAVTALAAETGLSLPQAFERAAALHNRCVRDIAGLEEQLLAENEPRIRPWLDGLHHMLYGCVGWQESAPRYSPLHEVKGHEIRIVHQAPPALPWHSSAMTSPARTIDYPTTGSSSSRLRKGSCCFHL